MEIEKAKIRDLRILVATHKQDEVIELLLDEIDRLTQIINTFEHHVQSMNKIKSECKIK